MWGDYHRLELALLITQDGRMSYYTVFDPRPPQAIRNGEFHVGRALPAA